MNWSGFANHQINVRIFYDCLQKLPYGVFITDEIGKILFTSDATCEIFGYSNEEIIGSSILEYIIRVDWTFVVNLFPIPDNMEVTRKIHFVLKNGSIWHVDIRVRKAEGYIYWYILETPNI